MNKNIDETNKLKDKFIFGLRIVDTIFITLCLCIFIISGYQLYRVFFVENSSIKINMTQQYNVLDINVQADENVKSIITVIDEKKVQLNQDTNNYQVTLPIDTAKHSIAIYAIDADGCTTNNTGYYMYNYIVYVLNPKDKSPYADRFEKLGIKNVYLHGVPESTQYDLCKTLEVLYETCPDTKGLVETLWVENLDDLEHSENTNVAAAYSTILSPNGVRGMIRINSSLLTNDYFIPSGQIIISLVHEYGHALNASLACERLKVIPGEIDYNKYLAVEQEFYDVADEMYKKVGDKVDLSHDNVYNKVSDYATTSSTEFFAECFAYRECCGQFNEVIDTTLAEYFDEELEAEKNLN